jgi:riboflavin kinase/FMN adenylyltransferase
VDRWNDLGEVPGDLGRAVVTIGNFDGVHRGHRAVLGEVVARARALDARAVAVTFDPHPLTVLRPDRAPEALTGLPQRLALLAETGVEAVLVLRFTPELASWSPERFVREVLVDRLAAAAVVVGRDVRFGHRNSGDLTTLRSLGERYGFLVVVVPDTGLVVEPVDRGSRPAAEGPSRWSSTWVRELIAEGQVERAAEMLGRPHRVTGTVVHGDHRGRALGYPTANLAQDSVGLVPADGVYAGWLVRGGGTDPAAETRLPAAISVGTNPTFDGAGRRVEAHVLDRDDLELYGETLAVEFVRRLRPMVRFDQVGDLLEQMARDVDDTRGALDVAGLPA